ncbi:hypothetical protein Pmar_PMAR014516 [Perkinsus marinus ATCC 50983]|uniref:Uncharacterized protein n=1 Tax=Perkinsus marinus (strain ATCC 50983 / TXsc) TaxID=423536 RepID=C5KWA4_PERM5|nr:hypothetical protein Pmar_PMAR014516 [Perkinsus marinus ATCC 50983]EER11215.1 hypothetical protein Pmar_PMAR014516 [Perkinsus marinus ATCC 50983]|eukprot:XP_002779420.1 hypothetical protein Pmar_PMAR014516 [Perkinsus marinus ATCC 50983]
MQPSAESAAKIPKVEVRSSRGSGITEIQQQQVHIHPRRGGSRAGSTTPKKSTVSSPSHGVPKTGLRAPAKVGKQIRVQHPPPAAAHIRTGTAMLHGGHLVKHKPQTTLSPPPPKAVVHPTRHKKEASPGMSDADSSDVAVAPPTMPVPLLAAGREHHSKAPQPKSTPKSKPDDGKEVPVRSAQSAISRLRTIEHLRAKRAQLQATKEVSTPKATHAVAASSAAEPSTPPPAAIEKTVTPKAVPKADPPRLGTDGGEQSLTERMLEAVLSQLIDTHSQWLVDHCGVSRESLQTSTEVDVSAMDLAKIEQMVFDETSNFEAKLKASARYLDAVRPVLDKLPKLTPEEEESFGLHQKSKPTTGTVVGKA